MSDKPAVIAASAQVVTPFDQHLLDRLREEAGIDVILATSRHNRRYLAGGFRNHYYVNDETLGVSRHQSVLGYVAGMPSEALWVGSWMDARPHAVDEAWFADERDMSSSGRESAEEIAAALRQRGLGSATVGIEPPFMSVEMYEPLAEALGDARVRRRRLRARAPAGGEAPARARAHARRIRADRCLHGSGLRARAWTTRRRSSRR